MVAEGKSSGRASKSREHKDGSSCKVMPNVRASATSAIMVYSVDAVPVSEHSLKHKTPDRIVLRKPKQFVVHADVLSVRSSEARMAPQRHPSDNRVAGAP